MPDRASSINHVEKRGEGGFPKKTMFVHKGSKIRPHGLWIPPSIFPILVFGFGMSGASIMQYNDQNHFRALY